MKDIDLEARLLIARPQANQQHSPFTDLVMQKIKQRETFAHGIKTRKQPKRNILRFIKLHRAVAIVVIVLMVAFISFTSYAYAIGSNPVSLIRRWVSGDQVNVEYKGRTFQYGSKRTYSDAAITAFAELNTVRDLYFKANNAFMVPKNGIEHVSNPYDSSYVYPWVGTIERTDDINVYIRKQYILGDKMSPSTSGDQVVTLPKQRLQFFKDGEHADIASIANDKLIEVFQNAFLEHITASNDTPAQIKQFFAFELTHTLDQIKEADQGNQPGFKGMDDTDRIIFEPSWGGLSDICLNNGADKCDSDKQGGVGGESLYDFGPAQVGFGGPLKTIPTLYLLGSHCLTLPRVQKTS
jgi:hypothetical protein